MNQFRVDYVLGQDFICYVFLGQTNGDIGTPETGRTDADVFVGLSTDGAAATVLAPTAFVELDAANFPGMYSITVASADMPQTSGAHAILVSNNGGVAFVPLLLTLYARELHWDNFQTSYENNIENRLGKSLTREGIR